MVRHAVAVDREDWEGEDAERPLTETGRKKMTKAARGLRALVERLDVLAASPLVRAQQTAQLLEAAYDGPEVETVAALAPSEPPASLAPWLDRAKTGVTVAVVGHEPGLSLTASWLLAHVDRSLLELKKGGACLLEVPRPVRPGRATLLWALQPGQLRRLAD